MQHLLRNQIISIALFIVSSLSVKAQKNEVFRPDYDEMPYHIGVVLGIGTNNLNFERNSVFSVPTFGKANVISSPNAVHVNLGLTGSLRLSDHFLLRGGWMFFLDNKEIDYTESLRNGTILIKTVTSSIPVALKMQSDRYNAFGFKSMMRHYVFGGSNISFDKSLDISHNVTYSGTTPPTFLKNTYVSYEYGFGLSFFLRHVTVSPEIKFSYGITNINDNTTLTTQTPLLFNLNKITSNFINFTIHLEN